MRKIFIIRHGYDVHGPYGNLLAAYNHLNSILSGDDKKQVKSYVTFTRHFNVFEIIQIPSLYGAPYIIERRTVKTTYQKE